jgi:hypothetical protein
MRKLLALGVVLVAASLVGACIGDVGNCDKDPTADCFKGKGTGGSTISPAGGGAGCDNHPNGCLLPLGSKCQMVVSGPQCASGHCVDGVCCESACEGTCMACSKANGSPQADGKCAAIPGGQSDPKNPECNGKGGVCGGTPGYCLCEDGKQDANETDVDCGGPCGPTCLIGQKCNGNKDCVGGFCVDGVCCMSKCGGPCESCAQSGLPGICSPIVGPDPGMCDGTKQCSFFGGCRTASGGTCSGDADCVTGLCKSTVCALCDAQMSTCVTGKCDVGAGDCIPTSQAVGDPCVAPGQCAAANCYDGVCCDKACTGTCMSCRGAYTGKEDGTCAPILAGLDPHGQCTGPGKMATCSGMPVGNGSSCGAN